MSQGPSNPFGTDATGVSQLPGGSGVRGWLSAIYSALTGTLNVSGSFTPAKSTSGTETNIAATTTSSTTLLAANTNRKGATVFQDDTVGSGSTLYLSLGATATTTVFTVKMIAGAYYEAPFGYTGIITGVWSAATGSARIVEFT